MIRRQPGRKKDHTLVLPGVPLHVPQHLKPQISLPEHLDRLSPSSEPLACFSCSCCCVWLTAKVRPDALGTWPVSALTLPIPCPVRRQPASPLVFGAPTGAASNAPILDAEP